MFRISDSREEISTCYMSEAIIKYGKDIIIPHPWISIIKKNRQQVFLGMENIRTRQSRRYAENPRDTPVFRSLRPSRVFFSKKQKTRFQIRPMGVCVPNFRLVSFFVWPRDVTQINTYTNIQVKLGISSTSCSPHVDFDNYSSNLQIFVYIFTRSFLYSTILSSNNHSTKYSFAIINSETTAIRIMIIVNQFSIDRHVIAQ